MESGAILALIPFYNRQESLLATLRSVETQSVLPTQLILVDDGSTDGGADVAAAWIEHLRDRLDCRLLHKPNGSASAARNFGLAQAQPTEYVAFLDSDDRWPADFLARTKAALETQSSAVAASCDRHYVFADGHESKREDCSSLSKAPCLWMLEHGAGVASCTLFRRPEVHRHGGFDAKQTSSGETALFLNISLEGPWLHVPGEPVEFSSGVSRRLGDEGNLSQKYCDNDLTRAKIYEAFFVHGRGQAWLNDARCRRLLARRWYRAGRQLFALGAYRKSLECFRKSCAFDPWKAKCYTRLCGTWFATLVRSGKESYVAA
jgi:glycosyltransferase involved in cell wall biosynthesis